MKKIIPILCISGVLMLIGIMAFFFFINKPVVIKSNNIVVTVYENKLNDNPNLHSQREKIEYWEKMYPSFSYENKKIIFINVHIQNRKNKNQKVKVKLDKDLIEEKLDILEYNGLFTDSVEATISIPAEYGNGGEIVVLCNKEESSEFAVNIVKDNLSVLCDD